MDPGSERRMQHPFSVSESTDLHAGLVMEDEVAAHTQTDNLNRTEISHAHSPGLMQRLTATTQRFLPMPDMRRRQYRTPDHAEDVIRRLFEGIAQRDDEIKASEFAITQLQEEVVTLNAWYHEAAQAAQDLDMKYKRSKRELLSCEEKIKHLETEMDKRDAIVRKVQESAFAQVDPADWKPEEDSVITSAFRDLDRAIQRWAKAFALKSLSSQLAVTSAEKASIRSALNDFVSMGGDGRFPKAFSHDKLTEKLYAMLAQAWASNHIYCCIIADPFFFVDTLYAPENGTGNSSIEDTAAQTLHRIMFDIRQGILSQETLRRAILTCAGDKEKAASWRSDLLRMLKPSMDTTSSQFLSALRAKTDHAVEQSCEHSIQTLFEQGLGSVLLPGELHDAMKELSSICKSAGALSYKLWARKNHIFVAGLSHRKSKVYHANSNRLDHHALHNNQLESDPSALDGSLVLLMLSPIVVTRGVSDAHNVTSQRIWKKGIAFMGLPDDNSKHETSEAVA